MARHMHSCKKNIIPDNITESSENDLLIPDISPKTPPTKKYNKKNIKV